MAAEVDRAGVASQQSPAEVDLEAQNINLDAPGRRYAFGWGTSSRKQAGPVRLLDPGRPTEIVV
jgi:hypothetical protein